MTWWHWAMIVGMVLLIWICGAAASGITEVKKALDQTNYNLDMLRQLQLSHWGLISALEEWKQREEADKRRWAQIAEDRRREGG